MIEFRHVAKVYRNQVRALDDVSFRIEAGEFVFFIGESGAGKSTLIKLLTCEELPTSGTVVLDHYTVSKMSRRLVPFLRRKIGMIFQDFRLIDSKTVFENVAFAMEIVGAPKRLIQRRVPMVLSVVGLRAKADAYPAELSGGEAQRVGIARAMVNNPRLILADEPTGNLDPQNSEAIMALLDEINRAGTTVIACTHDVGMVNRMRKRVIEFKNGHLLRDEAASGYQMDDYCYLHPSEDLAEMADLLEKDAEAVASDRGRMETEELDSLDTAEVPEDEDEKERQVTDEAEAGDQAERDLERRQNRESLATRIARMRLACEQLKSEQAATPEFQAEHAIDKDETTPISEMDEATLSFLPRQQELSDEEREEEEGTAETGRRFRNIHLKRLNSDEKEAN